MLTWDNRKNGGNMPPGGGPLAIILYVLNSCLREEVKRTRNILDRNQVCGHCHSDAHLPECFDEKGVRNRAGCAIDSNGCEIGEVPFSPGSWQEVIRLRRMCLGAARTTTGVLTFVRTGLKEC